MTRPWNESYKTKRQSAAILPSEYGPVAKMTDERFAEELTGGPSPERSEMRALLVRKLAERRKA